MRILLLEDDRQIAAAIRDGLAQSGLAVQIVHDGVLAGDALAREQHHLVILDLGLPGIDGMTSLKRYRNSNRITPVLILTARDTVSERVAGLDAGADDYLLKPFSFDEFEARVRALLRRIGIDNSQTRKPDLRVGKIRLPGSERRIFCDGRPLDLSPREFGVLELLLQCHGRVVSKAQLQDHLAHLSSPGADGGDMVGDTAIEVYVHRVRKKIEAGLIEIVTVRGFGYLLQEAGAAC